MCETSSVSSFLPFFLLFTVLVILKPFSVFVWSLIEVGIETNLDCMGTLMVYYYHHTCMVDYFRQNRWPWLIWDNENPPILVEYFHRHFYSVHACISSTMYMQYSPTAAGQLKLSTSLCFNLFHGQMAAML